jgi:chorismate mutase
MNMLRDEQQAALADINGYGNSLLLRYRELADNDERLRGQLLAIIDHRRNLLDQVAACSLARNDLPAAENRELTQLKSLTDRLVDYFAGSEAMLARILDAEAAWLDLLKALETLEWNSTERSLIAQLQAEAESAMQRLRES